MVDPVKPDAGAVTPPEAGAVTSPDTGAVTPAPEQGAVTPPAPSSGATPTDDKGNVPYAALHEERSKRQELQSELDSLKTQVGQMGQQQYDAYGNPVRVQPQPQPMPQQLQQQQPNEQLAQLWETDPMQAVQYQISMAFDYANYSNQVMEGQMLQAKTRHQDFASYEATIRSQLQALHPQQKMNPNIVETMYYTVKGRNADNLVDLATQGLQGRNAAGMTAAAPGVGPGYVAPPVGQDAMSEDENKVAALMGMTSEEYKAQRRK